LRASGTEVPSSQDWSPVQMPIALESGVTVSQEFETFLDGTFWILLKIRSGMPLEEKEVLLGRSWYFGRGENEPILIPWRLESNGALITEGDGRGNQGGDGLGIMTRISLGRFDGTDGGRYRIDAEVARSVPGLSSAEVYLAVEAEPRHRKRWNPPMAAGIRRASVTGDTRKWPSLCAFGVASVLLFVALVRLALELRRGR